MSDRFPWYDSSWLTSYARATRYISQLHPNRLDEFVHAFDVLRTDPNFRTRRIENALSPEDHARLKAFIATESGRSIEKHEVLRFGRTIIHDAELCNELQEKLTEPMSEWVNEPVVPCYNFLSLYNNLGICGMHLDAPSAKWTFDYCIEQSGSWPIHLSQVRPWPETWANDDPDWEATVRNDPDNQFSPIELQEGEAIIFSGSSQWHYRDRIYTPRPQQLLPPDILPLCSRRNATLDGTQMLGGLFRYSATD
jgi:hypothetical protein